MRLLLKIHRFCASHVIDQYIALIWSYIEENFGCDAICHLFGIQIIAVRRLVNCVL